MCPLIEEYERIRRTHADADRHFFARVVLGSSVIRVFQKGSKPIIMRALLRLDVGALQAVRSQKAYTRIFEDHLEQLARAVRRSNRLNNRLKPGLKWGHATKILCLFHRDLVEHCRYFPKKKTADRLKGFLFAPIDNIVIKRMKGLGYDPGVSNIKSINTKHKFYQIQTDLGRAAKAANVPRVWFDDNWSDRQ